MTKENWRPRRENSGYSYDFSRCFDRTNNTFGTIETEKSVSRVVHGESMDLDYTHSKFHDAMNSLASEGRLEERLARAFGNLNTLTPDDFPDENMLRERFAYLIRCLDILAVPRLVGPTMDEIRALSKARDEAKNLEAELRSIFAELAQRTQKKD